MIESISPVAQLAVDFLVFLRAVRARHVQGRGALEALQASGVEGTHGGHQLLCLEHLARAAGTPEMT